MAPNVKFTIDRKGNLLCDLCYPKTNLSSSSLLKLLLCITVQVHVGSFLQVFFVPVLKISSSNEYMGHVALADLVDLS